MSLIPTVEKDEFTISKFLDFDKSKEIFYDNIYLDNYRIVVKVPLTKKQKAEKEFKINRFDLTKYTFLLSYDQIITFRTWQFFKITQNEWFTWNFLLYSAYSSSKNTYTKEQFHFFQSRLNLCLIGPFHILYTLLS